MSSIYSLGFPKFFILAYRITNMASMDALSESAEMMIKNINELASNGDRVRTSDLSAKTELKPASVTEMIQRLGEIGLVDYEPYHGVSYKTRTTCGRCNRS